MATARDAAHTMVGIGVLGVGIVIVVGSVTNRDPFGKNGWFVSVLSGKGLGHLTDAPTWFGPTEHLIRPSSTFGPLGGGIPDSLISALEKDIADLQGRDPQFYQQAYTAYYTWDQNTYPKGSPAVLSVLNTARIKGYTQFATDLSMAIQILSAPEPGATPKQSAQNLTPSNPPEGTTFA